MLLDTTLIDGFEKIWRTASDERVCKTCGGLDGKIFAFDQRCFYSSYSKGIVPPALYRTQAHELMGDQLVGRAKLDRDQPNWSWEGKIADKMQRKGMTREEAIFDIYKTAIKSNANVNAKWGL